MVVTSGISQKCLVESFSEGYRPQKSLERLDTIYIQSVRKGGTIGQLLVESSTIL